MEQSLSDLGSVTGPAAVIVVTDGADDIRSGPDPIAAGLALSRRSNTMLHVVSLAVEKREWIEQLSQLSAEGRFTQVGDTSELAVQLPALVLGNPRRSRFVIVQVLWW